MDCALVMWIGLTFIGGYIIGYSYGYSHGQFRGLRDGWNDRQQMLKKP